MNRSRRSLIVSVVLALAALIPAAHVAADDTDSASRFIWPTTGRITQPYGCTGFRMEPKYGSCRHFHGAIDIADKRGTPIRAAADGVVSRVGWDQWGTGAWMVILNHGNGVVTWYAHMRGKQIDGIKKGVRVRQGQLIGYMDSTGFATGSHLHWAVLKNGRYANPDNYVSGQPQRSSTPTAADVDEDTSLPPTTPTAPSAPTSCSVVVTAVASDRPTAFVLESNGGGGEPAACAA